MAFGRKKHGEDSDGAPADGVRTDALVVGADPPLDNLHRFMRFGNHGKGSVSVLADIGSDRVRLSGKFVLDEEHWIVRGMRIPIVVAPNPPHDFAIVWDAIPSIEERARSGDATLVDPYGTRTAIVEALKATGDYGGGPPLPRDIGTALADAMSQSHAPTTDHFAESMATAARTPAPPGERRAVVVIATIAASLENSTDDDESSYPTTKGRHQAVLAVNIPGQPPYAVVVPKFDNAHNKGDAIGAGLPALVSTTDPAQVDIQWSEVPTVRDQITQRMAEQQHETLASIQAYQASAMAAAQQTGVAATPGTAIAQMPPEMRDMVVKNARDALRAVKDPKTRDTLIAQYRMAGLPVDEIAG